jgi:hypothetical protein
LAGLEEITRGVVNAPYNIVNGSKRLGERSARAQFAYERGQWDDAVTEGLYAVTEFSTAFTSAGVFAVPLASELSPAIGSVGARGLVVDVASEGGNPNIVYRSLNPADATAISKGQGLTAKAPNGTWTAAEHVANAGPGAGGAAANSPWISTSKSLKVAKSYDSGNGMIAIDLNKVNSLQVEVWRTAPRVNGVEGLPYHRSIWAQEVTIHQQIPANAILGPVK